MDFASLSETDVLDALKTSRQGLSSEQAAERYRKFGANELSSHNRKSFFSYLIEPFISPFVIILLIGGVISFITDNRADGVVISLVVILNALIEWAQQLSAARVLASLKKYSAKTVTVRRSGKVSQIDSQELVPGDIVLLGEGEKVPADGRLLDGLDLTVDESALTGESLPVAKNPAPLPKNSPIYQRHNMLFAGTLLQTGRAELCITATGNATQFGQIAQLSTMAEEKPPIVKKIKDLTFWLVAGTFATAALTVALGWARGNDITDMLRFGVALVVAVIPEGLPVTLTIILLLEIVNVPQYQISRVYAR